MALTINPCLSSYATGRLGDIVFMPSKFGNGCRVWYPPCNPRSVSQTKHRRQVFARAQFLWQNEQQLTVEKWILASRNWTRVSKFGHAYTPSPRQFYVQCNMNRLTAEMGAIIDPPISLLPSYSPTIEVVWTSEGVLASWSPSIPRESAIIFYQNRISRPYQVRPRKGIISHIFHYGDESPQYLSPALGPTGGPGDLPAFWGNSYIHIHARCIDFYGRSTPTLFFPIHVL
jgi:hypothetical protein